MASSTTRRRNKTISADVRLRFRPAESKLAQQLRDAATALDQGTASAHSVASTVRQAAADAIPQVQAAIGAQQGLSSQLQAAGGAIDPASSYGKAAAIEAADSQRRLGAFQARTVSDYVGQQARATQGEAYSISNLRNQHAATVERIGQQAIDLKAQEGDYSASLAGKFAEKDLQDAAAKTAADRADARARTKAAKDAKKGAHVTPAQQGALEDAVSAAQVQVDAYAGHTPRATAEHLLLNGAPAVPAKFDANKYAALLKANPTMDKTVARAQATSDPIPATPKIPALPLRIALDLAYHHRLTAPTIKLLHARKYKAASWPLRAAPTGAAIQQGAAGLPAHPFG